MLLARTKVFARVSWICLDCPKKPEAMGGIWELKVVPFILLMVLQCANVSENILEQNLCQHSFLAFLTARWARPFALHVVFFGSGSSEDSFSGFFL